MATLELRRIRFRRGNTLNGLAEQANVGTVASMQMIDKSTERTEKYDDEEPIRIWAAAEKVDQREDLRSKLHG